MVGSSRKRQRSSISSGNGAKRVETENRKLSMMLFDPDSLHCPICVEVLKIPIFQKCPSCASPIGHIRCRAMETVLESVFVPCLNAKLGCTKNLTYGNELAHEKECKFFPCSCPVQDCSYADFYTNLYFHYYLNHSQSSTRDTFVCGIPFSAKMNISDKILIRKEYNKMLLFAVQCFREPCGVYVTVSCIAPSAPEVGEFSCHLSYTVDGNTMTYESPKMKMVLQVSFQTPQEKFMLIPHSSLRGDVLKMEICIRKYE